MFRFNNPIYWAQAPTENLLKKITQTAPGAALTLTAIVLFWSFPSYDVALIAHEFDDLWDAIFRQAKQPFVNHNHLYPENSHETKLTFRFVPAIILGILKINSIAPVLIFQLFSLIIFYYLLIYLFNNLFEDRVKAFRFALPICLIVSGSVYTSDYRGIFDTLALDFLLIALCLRNSIYAALPLLLAYFTDERALIASPSFFIIHLIERGNFGCIKSIFKEILNNSAKYLFFSWIAYFALRLYLSLAFGLKTDTGGVALFFDQIGKSFYTVYIGLEGLIIPLFFVVYILFKQKKYAFIGLFLFCFALVFVVAQSVVDISRSMSYALIFVIALLILTDKIFSTANAQKLIFTTTLINVFYGDSYPLLAQLYRMKFLTHSI